MKNVSLSFPKILLLLAVMLISATPAAMAEIKLGILPKVNKAGMLALYTPLADFLSKETGEKVSLVIPEDYNAFIKTVKEGKIDLGFANPLIYIQLKREMNLDVLAVSAEPLSGTRTRGIILVRKDSGIERWPDLKGKKIMFVDKDAASGYMSPLVYLNKVGMDIKKDFIMLPFGKKHDLVALAVFNKNADAGGIREDEYAKMKNYLDPSQIKIVAYGEYFPNWCVFALPKMNKASAGKIKTEFLKLKPYDPKSEAVMKAPRSGFGPIDEKDFNQLREAARLVGAF